MSDRSSHALTLGVVWLVAGSLATGCGDGGTTRASRASHPPTRAKISGNRYAHAAARDIRQVVEAFVFAGVGRKDLAQAYRLTGPALRRIAPRSRWLSGDLPLMEYPVASEHVRVIVGRVTQRNVNVRVILTPRVAKPFIAPQPLYVQVVRARGKWLVNHFEPVLPPPVPSPTNGSTNVG
jgi:hypothetical protein